MVVFLISLNVLIFVQNSKVQRMILKKKELSAYANLKFFAKIVEKVAALQLQEYLKNCNLHAKSQSGYR